MEKNQSTALYLKSAGLAAAAPACRSVTPSLEAKLLLPVYAVVDVPPPLPEVAEIDLGRHFFVNLSTKNMAIDTYLRIRSGLVP